MKEFYFEIFGDDIFQNFARILHPFCRINPNAAHVVDICWHRIIKYVLSALRLLLLKYSCIKLNIIKIYSARHNFRKNNIIKIIKLLFVSNMLLTLFFVTVLAVFYVFYFNFCSCLSCFSCMMIFLRIIIVLQPNCFLWILLVFFFFFSSVNNLKRYR
uniref:Uncharacterized protein n=1 Tax=Cacopsylla melanoneura TaxID=428564 RepID=A0A8D9DV05_9HEMI